MPKLTSPAFLHSVNTQCRSDHGYHDFRTETPFLTHFFVHVSTDDFRTETPFLIPFFVHVSTENSKVAV